MTGYKITPSALAATVGLKLFRARELAELMNRILPAYGINTADVIHEFVANVAVESQSFTKKTESLYYTAGRLLEVWPRHFTKATAPGYAKNAIKLGNYIYGPGTSIGKQLQNTQPGDGFALRGSGFMHLTGRGILARYKAFKKFPGTVEQLAELLRTSDDWALDSAAWVFAVEKSLIDEAERDEIVACCKAINGGTNGLKERVRVWERAKALII